MATVNATTTTIRPSHAAPSASRSAWHDGRRNDAFIAALAHELRQPLAAMLAAVEVVRLAPDIEAARRAVHVIRRHISQMSRVVEDVEARRDGTGKESQSIVMLPPAEMRE